MRTDLKYTVKDYRSLPETGPRYQLVDGELVMSPAPTPRHQDLLGLLHLILGPWVRSRHLGKLLLAPVDVVLDLHTVLQPDLVFVPEAQKRLITRQGVQGAPALCGEILSPSTAELDLDYKLKTYARFGVLEYWIISPEERTLQYYRLTLNPAAPAHVFSGDETFTSEMFPGWSLDLREFFAE